MNIFIRNMVYYGTGELLEAPGRSASRLRTRTDILSSVIGGDLLRELATVGASGASVAFFKTHRCSIAVKLARIQPYSLPLNATARRATERKQRTGGGNLGLSPRHSQRIGPAMDAQPV